MADTKKRKPIGDWKIPGWIWYILIGILAVLVVITWSHHSNYKSQALSLANQQNVAQGQLDTAKNNQKSIKYVVSPNGQISTQGLQLINTGNKVMTLGTTFASENEYKQNVKTAHSLIWDTSIFNKNAFFGDREDYFNWVNPIKSQTQEVDTYQLGNNKYLSIVRFVTYTKKSDLTYVDQLKSSYDAFMFSGAENKILHIQPVHDFASSTGYQSDSGN